MIDVNKLKRNYILNPIHISKNGIGSEIPYKDDLEYLYIELNMSTKELMLYFNVTRRIFQRWIKVYR